ncbi:MAG: hypothetical protein ACLFTY_02000, partial [Candidatus Aenigmatarchaeota archaeon]
RDEAGNVNTTENRTIHVDTGAPQVNVESPENRTYGSKDVDLNVSVSEPAESCWWNTDPDEDQTSGNETFSGSEETTWNDIIEFGSDGTYGLEVYCNDSAGNVGVNDSVVFTVSTVDISLSKDMRPDSVVVDEATDIDVTTTMDVDQSQNNITDVEILDEVPHDFEAPVEKNITVTKHGYSPYKEKEVTDDAVIEVTEHGDDNTVINVTLTDLGQKEADYLQENDSLKLNYTMTSSEMDAGEERLVDTNGTVTDTIDNTKEDSINSTVDVYNVVLRGNKDVWIPDTENPQVASVEVNMTSLGGVSSELMIADYLPNAAEELDNLTVRYMNSTDGTQTELVNGTDYVLEEDIPVSLQDGDDARLYHYNMTLDSFSNWDGNLYENDTINIRYNVSLIGGGQWKLPTVLSGFDPIHDAHIRTEMHESANIPAFDTSLSLTEHSVSPGESIGGVLRMENIGGRMAKVDVVNTYSVRDEDGEILTQKSETFAVEDRTEEELELMLPEDLEEGMYVFESFVTYTGREAIATDTFRVEIEEEMEFRWLYIILLILGIVLLTAFMVRRTMTGSGNYSYHESNKTGKESFFEKIEEDRKVEHRNSDQREAMAVLVLVGFVFFSGFLAAGDGATGFFTRTGPALTSVSYNETLPVGEINEGEAVELDFEPRELRGYEAQSANLLLETRATGGNISEFTVYEDDERICDTGPDKPRCILPPEKLKRLIDGETSLKLTVEDEDGNIKDEMKAILDIYYNRGKEETFIWW